MITYSATFSQSKLKSHKSLIKCHFRRFLHSLKFDIPYSSQKFHEKDWRNNHSGIDVRQEIICATVSVLKSFATSVYPVSF